YHRSQALSLIPFYEHCLPRFFFFSSRRRHTRSKRDWSSDVCSSDLHRRPTDLLAGPGNRSGALNRIHDHRPKTTGTTENHHRPRSEERRVGKERRSQLTPDHEEKKI